MHPQAASRRAGSATVAALAAVLLVSAVLTAAWPAAAAGAHPADHPKDGPTAQAHPDGPASDRPPPHAGPEEAPPPHAHSPAPEDRPPPHAQAHGPSPHAEDGATTDGPGPARERPAPPGRTEEAAPAPAPAEDPGTELDTDVVDGDATRPLPDRTASTVGSPVIAAAPPATTPSGPAASAFAPPAGGDADAAAPVLPRDVAPGADPQSTRDVLAAPAPHTPLELFATEDVARRVVVPLVLLVAGLLYLLAQGRIDRRGRLLTAPEASGTEHDDDVYEL